MADQFNDAKDLMPYKAEPGMEEKATQILEDTIAEVGKEAREKGGYFQVLSEKQKATVKTLVVSNFDYYHNISGVNHYDFSEAMAENYLIKTRVFPRIMELAGYQSHEEAGDIKFGKETEMACLSVNGSYVMTGPGTIGSSSMTYTRLPLREGDTKAADVRYSHGVRLTYVPEKGDRFNAITPGDPLNTSNLIEVYARNPGHSGETVDAVAHTVTRSYTHIDSKTLDGFKQRK